MGGDQPIKDFPVGLQAAQGTNLVQPHQAAVLGDVGRKDCGELAFDNRAFCHPALLRGAHAGTNSFDTII